MAVDPWEQFVEWARHARAKPTFDAEERDYRLRVAAAVRALIEAASAGLPLVDPARAAYERVMESVDTMVPARQVARLHEWAAQDERDLAQALRRFVDAGEDAATRSAAFADAVAHGAGAARLPDGGLVVASLLNFSMSPERLPVVEMGRYGRLPALLGEEMAAPGSVVDSYRWHLGFARKVEAELTRAGVPVRDMVDVSSLIALTSAQADFWAVADQPGGERSVEPDVYLSLCAMYRNEGAHLAEWIEFHRLVGVERFFLLDNESDDESLEVLAPYIDKGIVVRYERHGSATGQQHLDEIKLPGFQQCIEAHGAETRWMAFIDTDEFLFSPTGRPVPEMLAELERWPAVGVNSVFIGASGHVAKPAGLVLESYTRRFETDSERLIKSIVDPLRVTRCGSAHRFEYTHADAVDEHGYPVSVAKTKSLSVERLRLNHYFARSEQDVLAKYARRIADRGQGPDAAPSAHAIRRRHAGGTEDTAITGYLPALRAALAHPAGAISR